MAPLWPKKFFFDIEKKFENLVGPLLCMSTSGQRKFGPPPPFRNPKYATDPEYPKGTQVIVDSLSMRCGIFDIELRIELTAWQAHANSIRPQWHLLTWSDKPGIVYPWEFDAMFRLEKEQLSASCPRWRHQCSGLGCFNKAPHITLTELLGPTP